MIFKFLVYSIENENLGEAIKQTPPKRTLYLDLQVDSICELIENLSSSKNA